MAMSARAIEAKAAIDIVSTYFERMAALADEPDALDSRSATLTRCLCPDSRQRCAPSWSRGRSTGSRTRRSERSAQEAVAAGLSAELGLDFEPDDIAMTQGAFGAISLAFALLADAGDEVVIPVPGWFCYEPMLHAANLVPVRAALDPRPSTSTSTRSPDRSPRARGS